MTVPRYLFLVPLLFCLGAAKLPNGAKLSWLLMQHATVAPPDVFLTGQGVFTVQVSSDLANWNFLATVTNSASWPRSTFAAYEKQVLYYFNSLAWNASPGATGYQLLVNDQLQDVGTNLVWEAVSLPPGTNSFRVAAYNSIGLGAWSLPVLAQADAKLRNSVFFRGPGLKIKLSP